MQQISKNPVTMQDVANYCNVTKMTVSRVIRNDHVHVGPETTERVLKAINELGYDPARYESARKLALHKVGRSIQNKVIAFYFPTDFFFVPYFVAVMDGVMQTIMSENFALLSVPVNIHEKEMIIHPAFTRGDVDGIISLAPPPLFSKLVSELRSELHFGDKPAISLMEPAEGSSAILVDDFSGGKWSATHLLDLGHRHILHFSRLGINMHKQRFLGYCQAYVDRGLNPEMYLHYCDWPADDFGDNSIEAIERSLQGALSEYPKTTAIIVRSDPMAIRIQHALARIGLRVPEDISLIGFDNVEPLCDEHGVNILTTVRSPLMEVGKKAVETIIEASKKGHIDTNTIILPVEPIIRNSTASCSKKTF